MPKRLAPMLMLAALPLSSIAGDVTIGDTSIRLPTPAGLCELSKDNASDARALRILGELHRKGGNNNLLGMLADCGQLADWRAGRRLLLDDYVQYITPIDTATRPTPVATECANLRAQGDRLMELQNSKTKAAVESTVNAIRIGEQRFIGVLAEEPGACYGGIVSKIRTEANTDKTTLTVFASAIVKNRTIYLNRDAVYDSQDRIANQLAKLKADVAALYAANR